MAQHTCVLHAGVGLLLAAGGESVMAASAGNAPGWKCAGPIIFADWAPRGPRYKIRSAVRGLKDSEHAMLISSLMPN